MIMKYIWFKSTDGNFDYLAGGDSKDDYDKKLAGIFGDNDIWKKVTGWSLELYLSEDIRSN
jgi:hypothetical protein